MAALLVAVIGMPVSAQTTTLSGTSTGTVSILATTGTVSIQGNSVLNGPVQLAYKDGSGSDASGVVGTMTSRLSGSGSLEFLTPDSTLVVTGSNTYAGGTLVGNGGTIRVVSGGSINHAADLTVGRPGEYGYFEMQGGSVSVSSSTLGTGSPTDPASHGIVTVSGGTWTTTNELAIGKTQNGSLVITGGAVNSGSATIGETGSGGIGSAAVTGGTWTNAGDLAVGYGSSLSIGTSGTVIVGGNLSDDVGNSGIQVGSGGTLQIGNGGNSGSIDAGMSSLSNAGAIVFNRTGSTTVLAQIDGPGSLVKQGSGTIVLAPAYGPNSFSGGTSINGGVLEVETNALGNSGPITFGGGTLRFSATNTDDYSSRFTGSTGQAFSLDTNGQTVSLGTALAGAGNTLSKLGDGTLMLLADNTSTGTTTVSGGNLQIGDGGTAGSIAGNLVNNAAVTFDRSNALTYGGLISGTGSIEISGTGVVTLSGTNTYSGPTILTSGTLSLGSAQALGQTSSVHFDGGYLRFTAANHADPSASFSNAPNQNYRLDTNGQNVTLAANLTSADGQLEKLGAGTLTLAGENTFSALVTLAGGTLALGSSGALGPADSSNPAAGAISFAGGTLQYSALNQLDYSSRFLEGSGGTYSIDTNGQTVTFATSMNQVADKALEKLGSGTLALTGDNSFTDGISLAGGTLRLGSAGAIGSSGPVTFTGGAIQFSNQNTTDVSVRFTSATGQAFRIDTNGEAVTFATALRGSGNTLTKLGLGTLTLSADNLSSGATTVSAGTLRLGDGGTSGQVAGDIVNNAALVFDRSDSPSYAGVISGTGSLTMDGTGTLTLAGANTYSGATRLLRGTLALGSADALGQTSSLRFDGGGLQYTGGVTTDVSGLIATSANQPINIDTNGENVEFATGLSGSGSSLAKYGSGTLTLSAVSTYTGGTTVGGGTLEVAVGGSIAHAASDVVVSGGALSVVGGTVSVDDVTLADGAGATGTLSVSAGSLNAAGTLRVGNGASATGALAISGGTVTTGATLVGDQGSGTVTVSGGTWNNTGNLTVTAGSVTISGGTVTVGGTLSEGAARSVDLQAGGELRIGSGGAGGALEADLDFAGNLVFNSTGNHSYGGTLAGVGTVVKQGTGLLTFTSAGTYGYSGQTTVSAGGLVVDGVLTSSSILVAGGGQLGGAGTVDQAVTVASGGKVAPGLAGSPALLTVGTLDLQSGSEVSLGIVGNGSLAGTAGTDYDALTTTGGVTIGASNVTVRLIFGNAVPFATGQSFQLFAFDGGDPVGHFSSVVAGGIGAYSTLTFSPTGGDEWVSTIGTSEQFLLFNERTGTLLVVPEPSTWGLLLAAAAGAAGVRRRRQKTLGT